MRQTLVWRIGPPKRPYIYRGHKNIYFLRLALPPASEALLFYIFPDPPLKGQERGVYKM